MTLGPLDNLTPEQMLARIRELEAELAKCQWQPIETAPKDGTKITVMAADDDGTLYVPDTAFWNDNTNRWDNGQSYESWDVRYWSAVPLPEPPA